MSKTLIVSYLPNPYSQTKKVLEHFVAAAKGKTTIVERNLVKNPAPAFDETSLAAYLQRGFQGKTLDGVYASSLKPFDALIEEISGVDNIVFAFPTHNWSEPGVVKTYIDAILQAGKTIKYDEKGQAHGQLPNLKAFVTFASGGVYDTGHPRATIQHAFTFYLNAIGITDITFAAVGGTLLGDDSTSKSVTAAQAIVDGVITRWYGAAKASA